eukprot:CAMPEP_0170559576 /NCGR_PEP_ID=MMETSP0211-20121228/43698_1 /TAXON_ID=311385 /ORGANISM="Pseudokeronopsis sp., Strain OXSARD2" /LENGTH=126 /DNA_ID=CAMNT_0010872763 /DNA_START=1 /DNA_END=378 /DNA_ORIENTATION=-
MKLRSKYLCCPKVPAHIHILEFAEFVEDYQKVINKVRIFKSDHPNEYVVAIKLNSVKDAGEFCQSYNMKQFNSIEPDQCVIYEIIAAQMNIENEEKTKMDLFRKRSLSEDKIKMQQECEEEKNEAD